MRCPCCCSPFPGCCCSPPRRASWKGAALLGFAWGWGHHLAGIYWVTHAILTDLETWWWLVPLAAPALAVPLALFAVPPVLAARALPPGWPRVLGFAGAWVFAEMARGVLFTGFPWNLIGSVWAFAALPIQGAALVGVHGLSLATVLLACLPLLGRLRPLGIGGRGGRRRRRSGRVASGRAAARRRIAGGSPRAGAGQRRPAGEVARGPAAGDLPALPRHDRGGRCRGADAPDGARRRHLAGNREPLPPRPGPGRQGAWSREALPPGGFLLAGTVRGEWGEDRVLRRVFNSLVALDSNGEVAALTDKFHLVPFGEYMPLAGLIPIRMVVGGMDFSAGPGPETVSVPGLPPFGALICYEVIFPGAVTPSPRPAWLLNITNDAWFGFSSGPWQHLAAARLRAAEEGLPLVRAAQTGISAVFDALRAAARLPAARHRRHAGGRPARSPAADALQPVRPAHPGDPGRIVPARQPDRRPSRVAKGCAAYPCHQRRWKAPNFEISQND